MVFGLSWLSGIGLVGFGKRLVRLDPHPRIKALALFLRAGEGTVVSGRWGWRWGCWDVV